MKAVNECKYLARGAGGLFSAKRVLLAQLSAVGEVRSKQNLSS